MAAPDPSGSRNFPVVVPPRMLPTSSRLGIAARLGVAFFAVAVLAAAANFIGEYGSSIVYTIPAEPPQRALPVVQPAPAPVPPPPVEPKRLNVNDFTIALDRFVRAVLE